MIKDFIKNLIVNLFIIESDIVNVEHLERWVYEYGNVVVFYHPKLSAWCVEPLLNEIKNVYGVLINISTITLKNVRYDEHKHFIYLRDVDKMPLKTIGDLAKDTDFLVKKQQQHHKLLNLPLLFNGDESINKTLAGYVSSNDLKVVSDDGVLAKGLQQINYKLVDFDYSNAIKTNFNLIKDLLGFDYFNELKKERMIRAETEEIEDWTNSVFNTYLMARLKFAEKLSSKGITFKVSVNE